MRPWITRIRGHNHAEICSAQGRAEREGDQTINNIESTRGTGRLNIFHASLALARVDSSDPPLSMTTSANCRFTSHDSCRASRAAKSCSLQPRPGGAGQPDRAAVLDKHHFVAKFVPTGLNQQRGVDHHRRNLALAQQPFHPLVENFLEFAGESNSPNTAVPLVPRPSGRKPARPAAACQSGRRC